MGKRAHARTNIVWLLATVALSSATMLWLFWHHPVSTGIATIAILSAFGLSARLARSIDTEVMSDLNRGPSSG